jgi:hypothetical protein
VASDPAVLDARAARTANAVIVNVDETNQSTRDRLADTPGVTGVFDDIQAIPQVADEEAVEDFLNRVREDRGAENVPPTIETEPTRPGDAAPDGGAVVLPVPQGQRGPVDGPTGPITSVDDSLAQSGAKALHEQGVRGESVISVIVDTGACAEAIRDERQLEGADLTEKGDDPWSLLQDHGGMSVGIMAGDDTTPGIERGFLPESDVFPIKTTLAASELIAAEDIIVSLADNNDKTVVVNNSWGFPECSGICDHPVTEAIENASNHPNVLQVFAAGNSAGDPVGCGLECGGETVGISGPNSLTNVITVAASGRDGDPAAMQEYSSRGGGGRVSCGQRKPDVTAPIFGTMPYGCEARDMGNGGGTSGACPQVAGVIGLIADYHGVVTTASADDGVSQTAAQFQGDGFNGCSGFGNVRADRAVESTSPGQPMAAGINGDSVSVAAVGIGAGLLGAALRSAYGQ